MDDSVLRIRMLGEFSVSRGNNRIDDSGNRSHKVWLLLAYMIYNRRSSILQSELIGLLWGDEERSANPLNALKTMFHRVRTLLNQLEPSAGHELIVRRGGSYAWNPNVPVVLDVEEFDALCRSSAEAGDEESRLKYMLQALALYRGDFLSKLYAEAWVVPIAAYYHNIYVQMALEALAQLRAQGRWEESVKLCRAALKVEPYHEPLYRHLMQALVELGDQKAAAAVYEEMSELLYSNFGVLPSDETRALYRDALQTVNDRAVSLWMVQEQLREPGTASGAVICDYDFFKLIYQVMARAVTRTGDAVHIGLLSVTGNRNKELSKRSLERAVAHLQEHIRHNMRRVDVAAQCSVSQYILMLPQANYENSCKVCERIIKSFNRQYPHSPARVHYAVQPLEPNV